MKYSIEINNEDVTFIIEAIKLRAHCLADDIEKQAKNIKRAHEEMEIDMNAVNERMAKGPTPSQAIKDAIDFNVFPNKKRSRGRPPKNMFNLPF